MNRRKTRLLLVVVCLLITWTIMPGMLVSNPFSAQPVSAAAAPSQPSGYDSRAVQATADNWTGQSRHTAGDSPVLKWSYNCGSEIFGSAVIGADGTVYFGAANGKIYAVDKSGSKKWEFECGSAIESSLAIGSNGVIYATTTNGDLLALTSSGSKKWSYPAGDAITASPVLGPEGTIYIGVKNGNIIAINQNGQQLWSYTTSGIDHAVAVDSKGYIYIGTRNGSLVVLDRLGLEKWNYSVGATLGSPVLGTDDRVYVAGDRLLYLFEDFHSQGNYSIGNINLGYTTRPALSSDGSIYVFGDRLYKYAGSNGADWNMVLEDSSPPVLGADGTVYLASRGSAGLYAISPQGEVIWQYSIGAVNNSVTLGTDGMIYACTKAGILYALDTTPVKITGMQPTDGAKDVDPGKTIIINFNKDIVQGPNYPNLDLVDVKINKIPVTLTITGKTFTIVPKEKLQYNSTYTVRIPADSFRDSVDHRLNTACNITFTTKQAPGAPAEPEVVFLVGQKFYKESGGQTVAMDAAPFINDGRTLIPVGFLAKALGVAEDKIIWNPQNQTVTLSKDNTTIIMTVGSNVLTVNGRQRQMDTVPINSVNGRVYLPAGFVAEALGYKVIWDGVEKSVSVYRSTQ